MKMSKNTLCCNNSKHNLNLLLLRKRLKRTKITEQNIPFSEPCPMWETTPPKNLQHLNIFDTLYYNKLALSLNKFIIPEPKCMHKLKWKMQTLMYVCICLKFEHITLKENRISFLLFFWSLVKRINCRFDTLTYFLSQYIYTVRPRPYYSGGLCNVLRKQLFIFVPFHRPISSFVHA